jgi:hypothetical protein
MHVALRHRFAASLVCLLLTFLLASAPPCSAYSVLTHEEIIDLLWQEQIVPVLLKRFPNASPEDLKKAHAFAYGGSVIQDIGYYPFGNELLSDLAHYVRTGDFVQAMLRDSQDLNEYAFAIGALCHYTADIHGHPFINLSVGIEYPQLAQIYGPSVPYDVDHKAHLKVEFGFDVLQVAKGRYASEDYHNFIGFEVSQELLERAFFDTYRVQLKDIMPKEQLAIGTYRRSVSQLLPEMTKVALLVKGDQLHREVPDFNREHFLYHLSKADYRKSWGSGYKEPGPGAHIMAAMFKVLPKFGPLNGIDFKEPTAKTEDMYFKSVDETIDAMGHALRELKSGNLNTPAIDLDTGKPTKRGEYPLADATYRELLDQLANDNFASVDPPLRDDILTFYEGYSFPRSDTRWDKCVFERWRKTYVELTRLRALDILDSSPSQPVSARETHSGAAPGGMN